jgi:hypothetical protein
MIMIGTDIELTQIFMKCPEFRPTSAVLYAAGTVSSNWEDYDNDRD